MINLLGIATTSIFLSISLLHIYWAFGSSRNGNTVIPTHNGQPLFTPSPGMTLLGHCSC